MPCCHVEGLCLLSSCWVSSDLGREKRARPGSCPPRVQKASGGLLSEPMACLAHASTGPGAGSQKAWEWSEPHIAARRATQYPQS